VFTTNPNNEYIFDIQTTCAGGFLKCPTGGTTNAQGLTDWEVQYDPTIMPLPPDPTSHPVTGSHFQPMAAVGAGGTVLVHIYRNPAVTTVTCDQFTITISN
jgi:hypothetical protein